VLVRHGETEWSLSGQHTGSTEIPLTEKGRAQGASLAERLRDENFGTVLTSPLSRARDTCKLAGFDDRAEVLDDLREWEYGVYEGRTTKDIRVELPGWTVWDGPVPDGETVEDVGVRADRVVERLLAADGCAAVFAHGHLLRVLTARWLGLPPRAGQLLALSTATISVLGFERETRVLEHWNDNGHLH
jgi:probable phosphoglycerate mutase